jgi:hypothetical protein
MGKESNQHQVLHNKAVAIFGINKDSNTLLQSLLQLVGHQNMDDLMNFKDMESKNYCSLFNIASIYFQQKNELDKTKKILLFLFRKLNDHNDDVKDGLFFIKVCFLLLEVLLLCRVMSSTTKNPALRLVEVDNGQLIPIDTFFTHVVQKVEQMDVIKAATTVATPSPSSSSEFPQALVVKKVMKSMTNFLLFLYKCRVCIVTDSPKQAKKEIKNALETFQKEIRKCSEANVAHAYMCLHNLIPSSMSRDSYVDLVSSHHQEERISIMDRLNQMALYLKVG